MKNEGLGIGDWRLEIGDWRLEIVGAYSCRRPRLGMADWGLEMENGGMRQVLRPFLAAVVVSATGGQGLPWLLYM